MDIDGRKTGVIVTHPHSLYGGDMYNSVVESVVRVYRDKDCATLRFNFRGVGNSGGVFDNGEGERNDVMAAISFFAKNGAGPIILAGYSFGAWVNSEIACGNIDKMVMVSPPAAFMEFSAGLKIPCLDTVIAGDRDEFGPPDLVKKLVPEWNPDARCEIIPGADHFYGGCLDRLRAILAE